MRIPLEFHDVRQLKLWRKVIYNLYEKYFDEYGIELIKLLNRLDELLNTLSTKIFYDVKIARVREFLSELDRFRVPSSKYLGRISEQLYRDIKEVIDGVFNFDIEGGVEDV
jgi:hypothetical protein